MQPALRSLLAIGVAAVANAASPTDLAPVLHIGRFGLKVTNVVVVPSVLVERPGVPEKVVPARGFKFVVVTLEGQFSGPGRYTVASDLLSVQYEQALSPPGAPAELHRLGIGSRDTKVVHPLFVADEDEKWGLAFSLEVGDKFTGGATIRFVAGLPQSVESFTVLVASPVGQEVTLGRGSADGGN